MRLADRRVLAYGLSGVLAVVLIIIGAYLQANGVRLPWYIADLMPWFLIFAFSAPIFVAVLIIGLISE